MKQLFIFLFCFLSTIAFAGKNKKKESGFDLADFNKKFEAAEWLCKYDHITWITSDSVMVQDKKEIEKLGKEWFCFQDVSKLWHAVYGKYENGSFDLVFHFTVDSNSKVERTFNKVDTSILNSYSRALIIANLQISSIVDSVNIRFNQFIRLNEDQTFTVWIFPAFQPNSTAVYGGEFIYTINQSGTKVLKDESYFQGKFRGFKVDNPREIWLEYPDKDKPTLGAIFFVWYYKQYFTRIFIDCSKSRSTTLKINNNYSWIHIEKKKEKKKNK